MQKKKKSGVIRRPYRNMKNQKKKKKIVSRVFYTIVISLVSESFALVNFGSKNVIIFFLPPGMKSDMKITSPPAAVFIIMTMRNSSKCTFFGQVSRNSRRNRKCQHSTKSKRLLTIRTSWSVPNNFNFCSSGGYITRLFRRYDVTCANTDR